MKDKIAAILNKVKSNELTLEEAKIELQRLKDERAKYKTLIFNKKEKDIIFTEEKIKNQCILLIVQNSNVEKEIVSLLKEKISDDSKLIAIHDSINLTLTSDKINMNLSNESHYEALKDYLKNFNKEIHIVYISDKDINENKVLEVPIDECLTHSLLFAKYFAYTFKKTGVFYQFIALCHKSISKSYYSALLAFGRSINKEVSTFKLQVIINDVFNIQSLVSEICSKRISDYIYFKDNKAKTFTLSAKEYKSVQNGIRHGVYVIIGGLGAIGQTLCRKLANDSSNKIILAGRRTFSKEVKLILDSLSGDNNISYFSCDVLKIDDLKRLFDYVKNTYGTIDYVINCAGILEDMSINNKTISSFNKVVICKIKAVMLLNKVLKNYEYKKLVNFTSTSGVFGNKGQCDYAYANMFIDQYCKNNKATSIAWPLWDIDGMKMPDEYKHFIFKEYGMVPLDKNIGFNIFKSVINNDIDNEIIVFGDEGKLVNFINNHEPVNYIKEDNIKQDNKAEVKENNNDEAVLEFLLNTVANVTGLNKNDIKKNSKFRDLGIDSIMISEINQIFTEKFGDISKTLFYEYETPKELASFLGKNYKDKFNDINLDLVKVTKDFIVKVISNVTGIEANYLKGNKKFRDMGIDSVMIMEINSELSKVFQNLSVTLFYEYESINDLSNYFVKNYKDDICKNLMHKNDKNTKSENVHLKEDLIINKVNETKDYSEEDIAVIGIAGVYPKADNLEVFWENLKNGADCISEIPRDRWKFEDYYDESSNEWWKSICKWGGFINNAFEFDPLFFNISPAEAKMMDPHQRVYAETVYHALEDAFLTKDKLSNNHVGVYTGAMWSSYQLYGIEDAYAGRMTCYDSSMCSISNRISYLFNFDGPSMTLDTMCSSSLVAIHLARKALLNNEIDIAICGGVNLTLHPYKYIQLTKGKFLAKDGRCRAFGKGGSGYVPGEGCGVVILKPLKKAVRDKNKIYCVIKSSAVNHGGKTLGYTVPSAIKQAEVIEDALYKSKINPESLSYIEAHGTGTALGDPIEIEALKKVFKPYSNKMTCSIGSVKSNIGHLEAASGMASLAKVILQMKHKMLVPSIHTKVLNPNLRLDDSPFTIQRELKPWVTKYEKLRAGISSFGAGGSNVHLIVEDYNSDYNEVSSYRDNNEYLCLLSGNDKEAVNNEASYLINYINSDRIKTDECENLAYTSQLGRNHFKERAAFIYKSLDELKEKLDKFILGDMTSTYYGYVNPKEIDSADYEIKDKNNLAEIAKQWIEGKKINWNVLYDTDIKMIDMPLYPFQKTKYWLPLSMSKIYSKFTSEKNNKTEFDFCTKDWEIQDIDSTNEKNYKKILIIYNNNIKDYVSVIKENIDTSNLSIFNISDDLDKCPLDEEIILDLKDIMPFNDDGLKIPKKKIKMLQNIIKNNRQIDLRYIHVTKGLNDGDSLNGVILKGLLRSLKGEYINFKYEHIDFSIDSNLDFIIKTALKELKSGVFKEEIFYKDSKRYVSYLKTNSIDILKQDTLSIDNDKCYVITGGTRGIGASIAIKLAEIGAKKIVLIGRSNLDTPEKTALLEKLKEKGCVVLTYTNGFSDEEKFLAFLQKVYKELGPIHYLIHCAGYFSRENPAFIFKTEKEIEGVLEPKVKGTNLLFEASKNVPIDKIIMFSSISSMIPKLSRGLTDYAAANAFMNLSQSYYEKKFNTTKGLVIVWPSWSGVGFKEKESDEFKNLHLKSLDKEEGLNLLIKFIENNYSGCVMPLKHEYGFNINMLKKDVKKIQNTNAFKKSKNLNITNSGDNKDSIYKDILKDVLSEVLGMNKRQIKDNESFTNYGMDSVYLSEFTLKLEKRLNVKIDPSAILEHDTLGTLSSFLSNKNLLNDKENGKILPKNKESNNIKPNKKFAVIGMSCDFPGAHNLSEFWSNLAKGICSIKEIPKDRFDINKYYSQTLEKGKTICKWAGLIDDMKLFDAEYFNISREEAKYTDPLIRLMLQNSVNALRNAGYEEKDIKNKNVGIFVGARTGEFDSCFNKRLYGKMSGLGQNFIAAYLSHYLDIHGPSMVIDSACSSALVSLKEACNNILLGECEMAIIGGVDLISNADTFLMLNNALSPDGTCWTFDERANGFVPGEGCGVVVVKELDKAVADNDNILAIIDSIAVNNDGRTMGITTPSINGQMEVIQSAINKSGINPDKITYIEAHGTGTLIGDPIELKALTKVYKKYTSKNGFCGIGSVKTNIGHLLCASGIASLIKVILAMNNKKIPETLHCERPNPRFNFHDSPFYPVCKTENWQGINGEYHSGISSFGFGGTNVHLILSKYDYIPKNEYKILEPYPFEKEYLWPEPIKEDNDSMIFGFNKMF